MNLSLSALLRFCLFCSCIFALGFTNVYAQEKDSLKFELFNHNDLDLDQGKANKVITSANRLAETPEEMAQEIIIIDGDEIRKFGYATLVDVLKNIPGFRTSQPGSSYDGETFLMRGIYGNEYAKILINGIPVKPEAVRGMPIGAQLPIRHAERIEIVLGPSSASYGTDAIAGVINIVLPEVDRPVFAWADINLMNLRATQFNLTLGGKVGKGKNILNYEIFASSHRAPDLNVLIPDDSIRVEQGQLEQEQMESLYKGSQEGIPEIDDIKMESRLMGAYLKFRWFEISAMNMFREEHSAIGSNPLASSYHSPGLVYGENINSFSLKYNDIREKRYMSKFALSALLFRTLTNSAFYSVDHSLAHGMNFMYARSADFNADYSGVLKINPQWRLALGVSGDFSISHPFTSYLWHPYRNDDLSFELRPQDENLQTSVYQSEYIESISPIDSIVHLERYTRYNVGGFAHVAYKARNGKFNGELGARVDYNSFDQTVVSPNLGFVYRPIEKLKIRGYMGAGYRAPRSYYLYNNYKQDNGMHNGGAGKGLERQREDLQSERVYGAELGIDWQVIKPLRLSLKYYVHSMENKIMREEFDTLVPTVLPPHAPIGFGFFTEESNSVLNSLMFNIDFNKKFNKWELDFLVSYQYSFGYERSKANDDVPDELTVSPGYRFVPDHMLKANIDVTFFDFTLSIRNNFIGNYITEIYRVNQRIEYGTSDKVFYNMDILLHKQIFRQLSIFGGVYNVFNSVQSGISNINLSDTWGFNPQYGANYKLGLTFKLN